MARSTFYPIALFALASIAVADPVTVVSVTNDTPGTGGFVVAATQFLQNSWSQTNSYTDVSISAWLFGDFVAGREVSSATVIGRANPDPSAGTIGTAYLTSASLAAPLTQSFTFPDLVAKVSLFSGLDLPAGTYFLTLASTSPRGGVWSNSFLGGGEDVTVDSGVVLETPGFSPPGFLNSSNPPESTFLPTENPGFFEVTGTPGGAPVPEPSSMGLAGMVAAGLILWRRVRL